MTFDAARHAGVDMQANFLRNAALADILLEIDDPNTLDVALPPDIAQNTRDGSAVVDQHRLAQTTQNHIPQLRGILPDLILNSRAFTQIMTIG